MKRLMVIMATALFGAAALTGCSSSTADSVDNVEHYSDTDTSANTDVETDYGSDVVEATMLTSDNQPEWLMVTGGNYVNYGYSGSVFCQDGSQPALLNETAMVEPQDGDLIYSFLEGHVPPGLIFPADGKYLVAIFDDPTVTEYRISGEVASPDQIAEYASNPTLVTTCY